MKYFALFSIFSLSAHGGLLPDYDTRCDAMRCHPAAINPASNVSQRRYFSKKVPKIIHQIWFGDPSRLDKARIAQWKMYAELFDYKYFLWSEINDLAVKSFMEPRNYDLLIELRKRGNYWSASDVLRYELMKRFGGVYVDVDFFPPRDEHGSVDLEEIVNFHGLTLMTENLGRNVGATALFAANGLIICPPNHPILCELVEQVHGNATHWHEEIKECWPMFETGPFLLNKVLSGCFNIVPCHYLKQFHMYEWDW